MQNSDNKKVVRVTAMWASAVFLFLIFVIATRPIAKTFWDKREFGIVELKWDLVKDGPRYDVISIGDSSGLDAFEPALFQKLGGGTSLNLNTYRLAGPLQLAWLPRHLKRHGRLPRTLLIINSLSGWQQNEINNDWARLPISWADWFALEPSPVAVLWKRPVQLVKGLLLRLIPSYSINPFDLVFERHQFKKNIELSPLGFQSIQIGTKKTGQTRDYVVYEEIPSSSGVSCPETPVVSPMSEKALESLAALASDGSLRVVIVKPPVRESLIKEPCSRENLRKLDSALSTLVEGKKGFFYIGESVVFPEEYFADDIHINEEGALQYTAWLADARLMK